MKIIVISARTDAQVSREAGKRRTKYKLSSFCTKQDTRGSQKEGRGRRHVGLAGICGKVRKS